MKSSNAELELIVDGLKRVIEKQKTEIEQLKWKDVLNTKHQEKVQNEKVLLQRIDSLELRLWEFESKETWDEERDVKLKKISEANWGL